MSLVEAIECILEKQAAGKDIIKVFGEVKVRNGKYGPYVQKGKTFVSVPKGMVPADLTEEECNVILESKKKGSSKKTNTNTKIKKNTKMKTPQKTKSNIKSKVVKKKTPAKKKNSSAGKSLFSK